MPRRKERTCPCRRPLLRPRMCKQILCPRSPFNQQPAQEPHPEGTDQPEPHLRVILQREAKSRTDVVLLLAQSVQPPAALRREEVGLCLCRKRQHLGRVPLLQQGPLACPIELLERVLAQGLQHHEARLRVEAFILLDKTLVDQRGNAVEDVEPEVASGIANPLGGRKRATADEDAESTE